VEITVRRGDPNDVPAVLALLDGATEWLVAQGRTDQWGTQPHSTSPWRVGQISGYAADGSLWIAEYDGRPAGALAIGDAKPPIPPADEPEVFVRLLVTDRALTGQGLGAYCSTMRATSPGRPAYRWFASTASPGTTGR
jgi:hypothetical protein